jgi:hypothetical protein
VFGRKTRPEQFVDREQARLSFLQTEYTAIRTELVAAVTTQQTVMSYALAAIAVFVWFVWYGEVQRLLRARWFLWQLEHKVNDLLAMPGLRGTSDLPPGDVLHWESWVRGRNRWRTNLHSRPAYHLASGLLGGTALGTTVLSVVLAILTRPSAPLVWLAAGGAVLFVLLCGYGFLLTRRNPLLKQNGRAIP